MIFLTVKREHVQAFKQAFITTAIKQSMSFNKMHQTPSRPNQIIYPFIYTDSGEYRFGPRLTVNLLCVR